MDNIIKILIIEDEPFAQNELKRLLQNTDFNFDIIDCIESVEDAIEFFTTNQHPDLVFFDIQLSDGISFDIFNEVKIDSPVIFTTAYDEYAIQAFKVNSIDYLLKPISQESLQVALDKFISLKNTFSEEGGSLTQNQLQSLIELAKPRTDYKGRLMVKLGDQIKFVEVDQIAYFYADGNEVFIKTFEQKRYIIDYTLDQLIKELNPINYHRLNRTFIANKNAVVKVHKYFNSRLKIELNPKVDDEVLVSRVKVNDFLSWMEK